MQSDLMLWVKAPETPQSQDTISNVEIEGGMLGVVQCVAPVNRCVSVSLLHLAPDQVNK